MSLPGRPTNNRYNNIRDEKYETQRLESLGNTQKSTSSTISPKKTLTQDFVIEEDWQSTEFPEIKDDSARERPPSAPVLKTPKKSSRPTSAGVKKTSTSSRPSSASNVTARKQQTQPSKTPVLDDSGSSRKKVMEAYYLDNVDKKLKKRKIPQSFHKDPEAMYMEIQELKQKISELTTINTHLRTNLQKTEYKSTRKQKQVEELLKAHAIVETKGSKYENLFKEVNLVKRLKQRIRDLEKALGEKEETFNKIKMDSRYTRVRELETELKAYYTESVRLQKLVEQLQQFPGQKIDTGMEQDMPSNVNNNEIQMLKEKVLKYRDLLRKMKQIQDHLRNQNEQLQQKIRNDNSVQTGDKTEAKPMDETKDMEIKVLKQELENINEENDRLLSTKEKQTKIISDLEEEIRKKDLIMNSLKGDLLKAKSDQEKISMAEEIRSLKAKIESLERNSMRGLEEERIIEEPEEEQVVSSSAAAGPSIHEPEEEPKEEEPKEEEAKGEEEQEEAHNDFQEEKIEEEAQHPNPEESHPNNNVDEEEEENPFAAEDEEENHKKNLNFTMNSMSVEEGETFDVHQNNQNNQEKQNEDDEEGEETFQPDDLDAENEEEADNVTNATNEQPEIADEELEAAEQDLEKSEEW